MKNKCINKSFILAGTILAAAYYIMDKAADRITDPADIDKNNGYLISDKMETNCGEGSDAAFYERKIKVALDKVLSFCGLVLCFPLCAAIGLAVYLDDPGPIFFSQIRVGKNKRFFKMHKFRTMSIYAPCDKPTHLLKNPDAYITHIGRMLRKTSLDELPQMWDIFRGKMSFVGPRPALWNQEDLVAEREKYGANSVTPGLTGWAQVNGRDEQDICGKAVLDGEYAKQLRNGGWPAFYKDIQCCIKTIGAVIRQEGIIEGRQDDVRKKETYPYSW